MKNGFTLLEILIALLVLSFGLVVTIPTWQSLQEEQDFHQEIHKLYVFLRQVQIRVTNSQDIWLLVANRDLVQKRWCLTVQLKTDSVCDCLNPNSCASYSSVLFYYPNPSYQTMLNSKFYYPRAMSRLSGIRDTLETTCFTLQSGKRRTVFSLFNVGSIKLKTYQSFSACENKDAL